MESHRGWDGLQYEGKSMWLLKEGIIIKNTRTHINKFTFCYEDSGKPLKDDKEYSSKIRLAVVKEHIDFNI